ncbi:bacillithiol system redox-active protein YtxJ [Paenibacillus sp. P96]|uniref:Bacillithiol system redox-active protein YtxJ n=1 Tax=Paenibacillus zeirhizosphaerae TaxID=2987519 RepID=A0ABT9FQ43_9BACL|nr:bacillithiol system redox-active protein YtxJ [Paenibacillus sp. P96]MDP4096856.1 bacillithiol system redox-active protein YtxJ [Paenibacillus sp. P96]
MATMKKVSTIEQLDSALTASAVKPLLLFKHSTRCPISARAHQEMEAYLQGTPVSNVEYGIIFVVEDRPVSNEVASKLNVKHESPQVILVKAGRAVWNTSHLSITSGNLLQALSGI